MKNYIGFVNDHSGSMSGLRNAALADYNANSSAIVAAASMEMLDTIVSTVAFGSKGGHEITREVVNSNPHVLKPKTAWPATGGTPLYDAIGDLIEQFQAVPDYGNQDVSFLLLVTTDGEELSSKKYNDIALRNLITSLQNTQRWTFVFRVPRGYANKIAKLGVHPGNIQEWETSIKGMEASTAQTTQAVTQFYADRSAGKRGSSVFYADATAISAKTVKTQLADISKETELFVVPLADNGIEIKPFIERVTRAELLKGAAFYQLTKTEAKVQHTKIIVIRDRKDGKMYTGASARGLIGLPTVGTARLHPGDHGNYDIFIQSTSVNRKLVGGTGVLYWKAIGTKFTAEDLAYLNPVAKPAVVQLPQIIPTNKPTPSPIPVTKKPTMHFFPSREDARTYARHAGKSIVDQGKAFGRQRWAVPA